jgi:excisionase family DNA binding protein
MHEANTLGITQNTLQRLIQRQERGPRPLLHNINEACRELGIGRTILYELIKAGELLVVKIGSRTLIPDSELQKFIAKQLG